MKEYIRERKVQERKSRVTGVVLTVALHGILVAGAFNSGLKYLDPPPPENTFLMDFSDEQEPVEIKRQYRGSQPRSEEVDKTKPIELIQKSESPYKAVTKTNATPATRPDDHGDVETPAVEQEKALDPRASFPGMSRKDTSVTAPHSAEEATSTFKAGQPDGNTSRGYTDGRPNARLKGRNTLGTIPRPGYNVQDEGTVVVAIWVDNYGNVVKAQAGADGTTVTNTALWNAARKAALETHFNQSADAPQLQEGTITYIFKLK